MKLLKHACCIRNEILTKWNKLRNTFLKKFFLSKTFFTYVYHNIKIVNTDLTFYVGSFPTFTWNIYWQKCSILCTCSVHCCFSTRECITIPAYMPHTITIVGLFNVSCGIPDSWHWLTLYRCKYSPDLYFRYHTIFLSRHISHIR